MLVQFHGEPQTKVQMKFVTLKISPGSLHNKYKSGQEGKNKIERVHDQIQIAPTKVSHHQNVEVAKYCKLLNYLKHR